MLFKLINDYFLSRIISNVLINEGGNSCFWFIMVLLFKLVIGWIFLVFSDL